MAPEWLIDLIGNQEIADIITRYALAALIILLTVVLLRRLIKYTLRRLLHFTRRTNTQMDEKIVDAIDRPLQVTLVLIGLWLALLILDFNDRVSELISNASTALIAITFFWGIYRLIDVFADEFVAIAIKNQRIDQNIVRFGRQLVKALVVIFAFVIVVDRFGYNLNGLLAGLGLGGLAVALAAQDALSNLVGYFAIVADSPFTIGDFIVSDAASGTVEHVGFRSTRIRQLDQSLVLVPNGILAASPITNWNRLSKRRMDMNLGLTYNTNPDQLLAVIQALRDMLENHPRVLVKDSVFVQFFSFNDSSLDVRIICYINEPNWGLFHAIKEDISIRMMQILDQHGVDIAFPTRTIVMESAATPPLDVHVDLPPAVQMTSGPHTVPADNRDMALPQPDQPASTDEISDAEDAR